MRSWQQRRKTDNFGVVAGVGGDDVDPVPATVNSIPGYIIIF